MSVESTKGGKRMSIADYYSPVMPYMVVKDADGFIKFLKAVFNAEERLIVRKPDRSIMHAEFTVNGGTILFGDASEVASVSGAALSGNYKGR
jgi:uncharacterized glyoxalase superfamily protein PhnB